MTQTLPLHTSRLTTLCHILWDDIPEPSDALLDTIRAHAHTTVEL